MKFARLAVIEFARLDEIVPSTAFKHGSVEVHLQPFHNPADASPASLVNAVYLVLGFAKLPPSAIRDQRLTLDADFRRTIETAAEETANAIAISNQCGRKIECIPPFYYLIPESEYESDLLKQLLDYPHASFAIRPNILVNTGLPLQRSIALLKDRKDGASLFAEAMGNTNALGRYRDFIRLFELAFRRDSHSIAKKLVQFLQGAALGYSREEIYGWLLIRDPASHADLAKTQRIAFERDVQPFMERMRQAALDVLLNKKAWGDSSADRRSAYYATAASTSADGINLRLTQGVATKVALIVPFDCFGAWPVREKGIFYTPPGWWAPGTPLGNSGATSLSK